jgi:hypothetical protein
VWVDLFQAALPKTEDGDLDYIETMRGNIQYHSERKVDDTAQHVLYHFLTPLRKLSQRLAGIPGARFPEDLAHLWCELREVERELAVCFDDSRSHPDFQHWSAHPPALYDIEQYVPRSFVATFDKFVEDVYSLSDLIEGEEMADVLRIDLWSARSQLYEIWVLLTVLQWLRGRGYQVELLKLDHATGQMPFRWSLSYANECQPCVVVRDGEGHEQYLFY